VQIREIAYEIEKSDDFEQLEELYSKLINAFEQFKAEVEQKI
jgi:hypothetical protein